MTLRRIAKMVYRKVTGGHRYEYHDGLTPLESQRVNGRVLFPVPVNLCVNRAGAPFHDEESHPITSTAAILLRAGRTEAIGHLDVWYRDNVHADWLDVFRVGNPRCSCTRCETGSMRHLPRDRFRLPWETTGSVSHKTPLYGPVDQDMSADEVARLEILLESLERRGFEIDVQTNPIRGYLLQRGEAYSFVVKGGQHRVAALAALGHQTVPATWQPGWARVVSAEQCEHWPHVDAGHVCSATAVRVFGSFFGVRGDSAPPEV